MEVLELHDILIEGSHAKRTANLQLSCDELLISVNNCLDLFAFHISEPWIPRIAVNHL